MSNRRPRVTEQQKTKKHVARREENRNLCKRRKECWGASKGDARKFIGSGSILHMGNRTQEPSQELVTDV